MAINVYKSGGEFFSAQCTNCNHYHRSFSLGRSAAGFHILCYYGAPGSNGTIVDATLVATAPPGAVWDAVRLDGGWKL
jgi:hypothetical protein